MEVATGNTLKLTQKDLNQLSAIFELKKPIYHRTVNLGVKGFKRMLSNGNVTGSVRYKLIKAYKKRAWMEFDGASRLKGSFPTHPEYGKHLNIDEIKEEEVTEYKVKVNNGTKQK